MYSREEFDKLSCELLACHKSYLSQTKIVAGLRTEIRGLADAAVKLVDLSGRKANLIDQLHLELEQQEPRIAQLLDFVGKLEALMPPVSKEEKPT